MSGPEWTTIVNGVTYTWEEVVFKISTGTWTIQQALQHTGFSLQALMTRLSMTAADRTVSAALSNAARTAATKAAASGAPVVASGGLLGIFKAIGSWLGLTGAAATAAGIVVVTAALGVATYAGSQVAGGMAADEPTAVPGPRGDPEHRRDCPPERRHETMCPWGPQSDEYFVGECGRAWCWDGGGRGTGACKPLHKPDNAKRTYTRDVICYPGFDAIVDPCTNTIIRCVPI